MKQAKEIAELIEKNDNIHKLLKEKEAKLTIIKGKAYAILKVGDMQYFFHKSQIDVIEEEDKYIIPYDGYSYNLQGDTKLL